MRAFVILLPILIIYFTLIPLPALSADTQDEPGTIALSLFYKNSEGKIKTIDLTGTTHSLQTGDQVKFYFKALKKVYFYLYHVDKTAVITRLFPESSTGNVKQNTIVYIPQGDPEGENKDWLTLINEGPESFYIIASTKRLITLETLTGHYRKAGVNNNKDTQKLHQHLGRLTSLAQYINEKTTLLQKPLTDPGVTSGIIKGSRFKISRITIRELYAKKIIINH